MGRLLWVIQEKSIGKTVPGTQRVLPGSEIDSLWAKCSFAFKENGARYLLGCLGRPIYRLEGLFARKMAGPLPCILGFLTKENGARYLLESLLSDGPG